MCDNASNFTILLLSYLLLKYGDILKLDIGHVVFNLLLSCDSVHFPVTVRVLENAKLLPRFTEFLPSVDRLLLYRLNLPRKRRRKRRN